MSDALSQVPSQNFVITHKHSNGLHLEFDAVDVNLMALASEIRKYASEQGWSEPITMQIDLVLEELVLNAMSYGYPEGGAGCIRVHLQGQGALIHIDIEDDGIPFNPFSQPQPDFSLSIEDREIGGLGIHFVREFMDEFAYERKGSQNHVSLVKHLHEDPESSPL